MSSSSPSSAIRLLASILEEDSLSPMIRGWAESLVEEMESSGIYLGEIMKMGEEKGLLLSKGEIFALLIPSGDQGGFSLLPLNHSPDYAIFIDALPSESPALIFPQIIAEQISSRFIQWKESGITKIGS